MPASPSGPHLTPDEWGIVDDALQLAVDVAYVGSEAERYRPVLEKVAQYTAARMLHAARDPRINDPYSTAP